MSQPPVYLGIDVSKASLDACFLGQSYSLPNSKEGIARLIKIINSHDTPVHVVCEATGGVERALCAALHSKNITLSVVNPRLPRDFARAANRLAKTDLIDAALLAAYGAAMHPSPTPPPCPAVERLLELVSHRTALVADRAALKTRLQQAAEAWLRAQIQRLIKAYDLEIKKLEARMREHVASVPVLAQRVERLEQAAGVGWCSALTLCACMPELGSLNRAQTAALAGLAPSTVTAVNGAGTGISAAAGRRCVESSTRARSRPYAEMRCSKTFMLASRRQEKPPRSPSLLWPESSLSCSTQLSKILSFLLHDNTVAGLRNRRTFGAPEKGFSGIMRNDTIPSPFKLSVVAHPCRATSKKAGLAARLRIVSLKVCGAYFATGLPPSLKAYRWVWVLR